MKWPSVRDTVVAFLAIPVACTLICSIFWSLRWPLVGDASLMHYAVFLMSKGMRLYRDIHDINLPGTYFSEFLVMRLLGTGALAWRVYDLLLLALIAAAMLHISRGERRWLSGVLAAAVFALIHIQDGIAQLGQRDLLITLLLLAGYAALFAAERHGAHAGLRLFSAFFFIGATLTIKPAFFPLGVLLIGISARRMRELGVSYGRHFSCSIAGLLSPSVLAMLWLLHEGALSASADSTIGLILFHADLGRKPFSFLLAHATSPIPLVLACWIILLALLRPRLTLERIELLAGIVMAFVSYASQGKGYPYHRYPLIALLLVAMERDFIESLWTFQESPRRAPHRRLRALIPVLVRGAPCRTARPLVQPSNTFSGRPIR